MIDAGVSGINDNGCQHLSKLESERVEVINLNNLYSQTGRDGCMKKLKSRWVPGGRDAWRRRPRRLQLMTINCNDNDREYY